MKLLHSLSNGWGRRIRTSPTWSRAMRPTARLSPSAQNNNPQHFLSWGPLLATRQKIQSFLPNPRLLAEAMVLLPGNTTEDALLGQNH